MGPHASSILRSRGAALGLVLSAMIVVFLIHDASLSHPFDSQAATVLNGQPLRSIDATYSSETSVFGTLFESTSADRRLALELDSTGVLHLKGLLKDPFEQAIPLESKHLKGSSVRWTIKREGQKFSGQIQSIQLFATPFQTFEFTLPPQWESFAPTQAVKGSIDARVEGLTVRLNGTLLASGTLPPLPDQPPSSQGGSRGGNESPSLPDPPPEVAYDLAPPGHFTAAVASKVGAPSIIQATVEGIVRLQWDRVVDPAFLPSGSDIGFEIQRSIDGGPFSPPISVAVPSEPRLVNIVPGTVAAVFDPLDLSTVRGKRLQYRVRMVDAHNRSEFSDPQTLTIAAYDLVAGPLRMVEDTGGGCAKFSYSIVNQGYNVFTNDVRDRFSMEIAVDGAVVPSLGYVFVPGVGSVRRYYSPNPIIATPANLGHGQKVVLEETICFRTPSGTDSAQHTVSVMVDSVKWKNSGGQPGYFILSNPSQSGQQWFFNDNAIAEDNEHNNTSTLTIESRKCPKGICVEDPRQRPDLVVENLTVVNSSVGSLTFHYTIYNRGTKVLSENTAFFVAEWVDGKARASHEVRRTVPLPVSSDAGGGFIPAQYSMNYHASDLMRASHTLEVRVDSTQQIKELNEDNNSQTVEVPRSTTLDMCFGKPVDVLASNDHCGRCANRCLPTHRCDQGLCRSGVPDLAITNPRFLGTTQYMFDVANIGNAPVTASSVAIAFMVDGTTEPSSLELKQPQEIQHQRATFVFNLPSGFQRGDSHRLEIIVDPDNKLKEKDKGNNRWIEKTGPSTFLVRLELDGQRLAFVEATPIIANQSAQPVVRAGRAYRGELTYDVSDAVQRTVETFFSVPVDQHIRLVNDKLIHQDIGGKKLFTVAIPYTGTPKRLRVWEADEAETLIDISFDANGNVLPQSLQSANTPSVVQKAVGVVRSQWEKIQKATNAMMCRAFGWNNRLHQFFGCSQE